MSPRPGGEAAKFGARFEGRWTVRYLIDVLMGRAESVTVEAVDADTDSVEFLAVAAGREQAHQVKRQWRANVSWPVSALRDAGVLAGAAAHVDRGREFHFISTLPARTLDELTDAARRSDNYSALAALIAGSKRLRDEFDVLANAWGTPQDAHGILQQVYVWKPDERHLQSTNVALAEWLIEGSPDAAVAVLADLVLDNLAVSLTSAKLWRELEARGLRRSPLYDDKTLPGLVGAQATRWLAVVQRELLQPPIERAETDVATRLLQEEARPVMVVGDAGAGKSAVVAAVVERLTGEEWPALPLRLDRHSDIRTSRQLGNQLDLPVSPVVALGAVAAGNPALLVIDQLDAVSLVSGRSTEVFDVVEEVLREVERFPNIRVLFACRQFDIDNDQRLRALLDETRNAAAKQVPVAPLENEQILAAVDAMGLDTEQLEDEQLALLRLPLNLVLLRAVAGEDDALTFATTRDLLDQFWRAKRRAVIERRAPREIRFDQVIARLVEAMSDSQRLAVPESVLHLDSLDDDATVLASEHVIVNDRGRYAFFHERLFDYAFARAWVSEQRSVLDFLLAGEQELFRRAQVRQVLIHLREAEPERFVNEARELLVDASVRFHIKDAVLALLRALPDPSSRDLQLILELLNATWPWRERLELLLRTVPWFDRLREDDVLKDWLGSGDSSTERLAVAVMGVTGEDRASAVAELLETHRHHSDFLSWLTWIGRFVSLEKDRGLFELFLATVRDGQWEGHEDSLWPSARSLGDNAPRWAVELLAAWLRERPQALASADGRVVDMAASDYGLLELVKKAADGAPIEFALTFLPYMKQVMHLATYDDHRPLRDWHFASRFWNQHLTDLDETLAHAMASALRKVAVEDSTKLRELVEPLVDDPHAAAQDLLYEALRAAGTVHADWAADLLLRGGPALESGYSDDDHWTTRQLLEATAEHMSEDRYARLEEVLLAYAPEWERKNPSARGHASFTLLSALPEGRLSEPARRRLGELRRKFGREHPEQPRGIWGGMVGSPIELDNARRMTDKQWLSAMRRYASDEGDRDLFELRGGAHELSQVLKEITKEQPNRFARLALELDSTYNTSYLDAILMGLGDSEADFDADLVYEVIRHAAASGRHDRWLGYALKRFHAADVPDDVIRILLARALGVARLEEVSEPASASGDEPFDMGDPFMSAINSDRGANVHTLAILLAYDTDGSRATLIEPYALALATDPSVPVRTCVAEVISGLLRWHRETAIRAFRTLVQQSESELVTTRQFEELAAAVVLSDVGVVLPTIERMLKSDDEKTREHGARLATFAATDADQDSLLGDLVASPDAVVRRGVASVLADRVRWVEKTAVTEGLVRLFGDPDHTVREAAARFVIRLRGQDLTPYESLIHAFIESDAILEEGVQLMFTLEQATSNIDHLTLRVAQRFLVEHGDDVGNVATSAAGDVRHIGELVLRSYAQAEDSELRAQLLDVIDRLLELGAYGFQDAVDEAAR